MGDTLKKVQPGQRLNIPAQTFNTFIDAARDYLQRRQNTGGDALAETRQMGVVLVKNTTGEDRGLFEILALDGPVYTPDDNEEGFKFRFALKGIKPDTDHFGNFAILLEPGKDGEIGRALVEGITPVKVQVETEGYGYADVCTDEGSEYLHLKSGPTGAAYILWIESGTGEKWAIVRVANLTATAQEAAIHGLKVTGVWKAWGVPWSGFEADGYITFVSGQFAFLDKSWVDPDPDNELYIKVTGPRGKNAPIGYRGIAEGDFIGWVAGDHFEPIPGSDPAECYDGEVVPFVGPEGALPDWGIVAGKGLKLEDPVPYDRKLHVELDDVRPGLEFDVDTDDGRLRVKPNEERGIKVTVSGVEVIPDTNQGIDVAASGIYAKLAQDPGLEFDSGGLKVKPNGNEAVHVDADGVGVSLENPGGLEFGGGGGLKVRPDTTRGLDLDASGVFVKIDPNYGLQFDGGGTIQVKTCCNRAVDLDAESGAVQLLIAGGAGHEVNESGLQFDGTNGVQLTRAWVCPTDPHIYYQPGVYWKWVGNPVNGWVAGTCPSYGKDFCLTLTGNCDGRIVSWCDH